MQKVVSQVLIDRYISLIESFNPSLTPKEFSEEGSLIISHLKDKDGSLSLNHLLWMLYKMKEPSFKPLTSYDLWIGFVQAGLFSHSLIEIKFEKDITREVCKQYFTPPKEEKDL